jgi:hypothetical protein
MNETEIAAKVAENIKTEEHIPAPVVEEAPKLNAFESSIELNDPAIGLELADYFGLSKMDRFNEEGQQQLRALYRWGAERAGSTEKGDVLEQLHLLSLELGVTFKPDRLGTMSRWVKLSRQADALRKEMDTLSAV